MHPHTYCSVYVLYLDVCVSSLVFGKFCDWCLWQSYSKFPPFCHHLAFSCHKVFNCFGKYFCLHFEAFNLGTAPVYMAFLQFMGEADEASRFHYSLEVGGSGRRQVWQGVSRSIRDTHQSVRDSVDGLLVPRGLALLFSGGDCKELKLRVMGRIWKEH